VGEVALVGVLVLVAVVLVGVLVLVGRLLFLFVGPVRVGPVLVSPVLVVGRLLLVGVLVAFVGGVVLVVGRLLVGLLLGPLLLAGFCGPGALLLLEGLLVGLDDLAVADLAAPALHLFLVQQDVRHRVAAEVLELQPGPPALGAPEVPGPLEEPLRV